MTCHDSGIKPLRHFVTPPLLTALRSVNRGGYAFSPKALHTWIIQRIMPTGVYAEDYAYRGCAEGGTKKERGSRRAPLVSGSEAGRCYVCM